MGYLNNTGLSHFWNAIKSKFIRTINGIGPDTNGNVSVDTCEFINGTQTAATGSFTGVSRDSSLYDGKHIIYRLPYAGSGNATLNLTLADGTTTGAKNVWRSPGTRLTTQYAAGNFLGMTYFESDDSWHCDVDVDTDSYAYAIKARYNRKVYTNLYRYQFCFTKDDTYILPVNTVNNNTGTSKQLTTEEFNPFGDIYWYWTTTSISANGNVSGTDLIYNYWLADMRYSFNCGTTLTASKDVYIVCVPQKNGKVKLANPAITQELPTTEDGLVYIRLGRAYDTYRVEMGYNKPIYYYMDGEIREWTNAPVDAKLAEYNTDDDVFQIRHAKAEKPSYNSEVVRKITGGTLAWNQLASLDIADWQTHYLNVTITERRITLVPTTSGSSTLKWLYRGVEPNHKILVTGKLIADGANYGVTFGLYRTAGSGNNYDARQVFSYTGTDQDVAVILNGLSTSKFFAITMATSATTENITIIDNLQVFDLTQTFGSAIADRIYALEQATADAGVAWFRRYFNLNYYEHNQTLANTYFDQYDTTGMNLWDEEWEVGSIISSTGANTSSSTTIRSKNYIRVIPNATYYVKASTSLVFYGYDADKIFITGWFNGYNTASRQNATLDVPSGVHYLRFVTAATTYANDICINLSDESRNGQYEPYRHSRITFFDNPVLLRGIPYLDENDNLRFDGDTLEANGKLTRRYGVVDLGTLDWKKNSTGTAQYYTTYAENSMASAAKETLNALLTKSGYIVSQRGAYNGIDKNISLLTTAVWFTDSDYSTASDFKASLSGVMLVYELATPTEEESTPIDGPLVSDPLGLEVISRSDRDDTPTLAQMDILYANEVRANVEMIATNKVVAMRRAITTKRGMPVASEIDLNTFCNYGEYDISLSTVSNAPPDVTGIKLIVQSTVADTETAGGQHPKDTIQIFIGSDTSGIVKIFTRLYLRTSQNIKYWSSWSSSGPAPILELSNCSWRGDEVQASISNMSVYDVDGMDILAIKVPCVEGGDYEDDAFICIKAYDSILNNDRLIFTSVPNSDGRYLQLTLESNNTGTIVSGEILNIHDVIVYNITFDSQGEANQPISFSSALALLLSGKMIVLKAGGIYYYPAYNVTSNTNYIMFATTLDDSGYWNCCMWSSSTGKISTEEYDFMGMVYTGYGRQFIPSGGTTGQFLVKNSNANYDVGWVTVPNANGVSF